MVTETAVETLRARGEPARYERLLGEILVGLDRAGQLRRLAAAHGRGSPPDDATAATTDGDGAGRRATTPKPRPVSAQPAPAPDGRPTGRDATDRSSGCSRSSATSSAARPSAA